MSETTDYFDAGTSHLVVSLPTPPPDNACHVNGRGGRFATKAYKAWLQAQAPRLRALLGDWTPDTSRWWHVEIEVLLGSVGDSHNFGKALLDWLSGSYVDEAGQWDPIARKTVGKGRIRKPGALWDDDRRVRRVVLDTPYVRHAEPTVILRAWPTEPPIDWREKRDAQVRAAKARAQSFAAAWTWERDRDPSSPRRFNGIAEFDGQRYSASLVEGEDGRWIALGRFTGGVLNCGLAQAKREVIKATWARVLEAERP